VTLIVIIVGDNDEQLKKQFPIEVALFRIVIGDTNEQLEAIISN
jgi:hypothetical protein